MTMWRTTFFALALLIASGASAAPTNYTGFWKENCNDPYGLQIKPFEERYTVTFCGPGGCGTIDPKTATSIEGDTQYEVLSPERIKIIYAEQYTPIYVKCTTDTSPLLEYSEDDRAEGHRSIIIGVAIHIAYLVAAILLFIFMIRQTRALPPLRRRAIQTGLAALLFSPGIYLSWPFATPTFAALGLVFSVATAMQTPGSLFAAQLMFALGPILGLWGALFAIAHVRSKLSTSAATGI